jgi:transposase
MDHKNSGFVRQRIPDDVHLYPKAPNQGQVSSVAFGRPPVIQTPKLGARIMRYELADCEWVAIKPMLPNKPRGVPRVNDRRVLSGIFWVLRSGAPWRDLPEAFGPYTTCYATRYDKFAANYLAFVQLKSIRLWLRVYESAS